MEAIVAAITAVPEVTLLDREADADHNRSVLTFVGPPAAVAEAALRGVEGFPFRGRARETLPLPVVVPDLVAPDRRVLALVLVQVSHVSFSTCSALLRSRHMRASVTPKSRRRSVKRAILGRIKPLRRFRSLLQSTGLKAGGVTNKP